MIFAIYTRKTPKDKWHVVAMSINSEAAVKESDKLLQKALQIGNNQTEVAVQSFDSTLTIPEYLINISDQKLLLN
jgi:hypothetical protein